MGHENYRWNRSFCTNFHIFYQNYPIFTVNSRFHHIGMWRVSVGRPSLTKAFRNNILIGWSWSNSSFGSSIPSKNRPKSPKFHKFLRPMIHKILVLAPITQSMTHGKIHILWLILRGILTNLLFRTFDKGWTTRKMSHEYEWGMT